MKTELPTLLKLTHLEQRVGTGKSSQGGRGGLTEKASFKQRTENQGVIHKRLSRKNTAGRNTGSARVLR